MLFHFRAIVFFSFFATLSSLNAHYSFAGGSVSGGGEFITNEHNPWFIGKKKVTYCLQIDTSGFSLPYERAQALIRKALDDWRDTFQYLAVHQAGSWHSLPTTFDEEDCRASTDLKFFMGLYETEHPGQLGPFTLAYAFQFPDLNGPSAKGTINFAPDRGAHAYRLPVAGGKENFWRDEDRFYAVLLHEIGHAYGVPHIPGTLMATEFPAQTVFAPANSFFHGISSRDFVRDNFGTPNGPAKICGQLEHRAPRDPKLAVFRRACIEQKQPMESASFRSPEGRLLELTLETSDRLTSQKFLVSEPFRPEGERTRITEVAGNLSPFVGFLPSNKIDSSFTVMNHEVFARIQDSLEIIGTARLETGERETFPVIIRYGFPRRGTFSVSLARNSQFEEFSFVDESRTTRNSASPLLKNETDRN